MIDWDEIVLGPIMTVFGQEDGDIVFLPATGGQIALPGAVFNQHYLSVHMDHSGNPVSTIKPAIGVRAALFTQPPKQNDRIRFVSTGLTYAVNNVEDDGLGHLNLTLNRWD